MSQMMMPQDNTNMTMNTTSQPDNYYYQQEEGPYASATVVPPQQQQQQFYPADPEHPQFQHHDEHQQQPQYYANQQLMMPHYQQQQRHQQHGGHFQRRDPTSYHYGPTTLSVHDPEYRNLITVPYSAVHHVPPQSLGLTRLVLCKRYDPRHPHTSCPMGDSCKFVHLDLSHPEMTVQSIHVNYAYRNLQEVKYETLPPGEQIAVMAPNNTAPSQLVPSEMILKTAGALERHSGKAVNCHCAHYYYNRMCYRGERCNFLHCLYIDPSARKLERAPSRVGASVALNYGAPAPTAPRCPPAAPPAAAHYSPVTAEAPPQYEEATLAATAPNSDPSATNTDTDSQECSALIPQHHDEAPEATMAHHVPTTVSKEVPSLPCHPSLEHSATTCSMSTNSCDLSGSGSGTPRSSEDGAMKTDSPSSSVISTSYRHNPYTLLPTH